MEIRQTCDRLSRPAHSHWRWIGAFLAISVLLAQPTLVAAQVESAMTFEDQFNPTGPEPATTYCAQSGVVENGRSKGKAIAFLGTAQYVCSGSANVLPAGWLGVSVQGLRDGVSCGYSPWSYSSSATSAWTLWSTECSNPSGLQSFRTRSFIRAYDGEEDYFTYTGPLSPAASY